MGSCRAAPKAPQAAAGSCSCKSLQGKLPSIVGQDQSLSHLDCLQQCSPRWAGQKSRSSGVWGVVCLQFDVVLVIVLESSLCALCKNSLKAAGSATCSTPLAAQREQQNSTKRSSGCRRQTLLQKSSRKSSPDSGKAGQSLSPPEFLRVDRAEL